MSDLHAACISIFPPMKGLLIIPAPEELSFKFPRHSSPCFVLFLLLCFCNNADSQGLRNEARFQLFLNVLL